MTNERTVRLPKIWEALIPVIFLMVIIIISTVKWGIEPHMPIVASSIVAALIAMRCGHSWGSVAAGGLDSIKGTVEALIIIMCVGMLIGSWVWSGTMPAMVYYGLKLITPGAFLVVGCILTLIVGISTGSSWTASGTVGVALMGISMGLGINPAIAAGMVISGAYTGDKLSPLSDSTNVAAAAAQTPLYDHVRAMMTTTIPSFSIALVLYAIVGAVVVDEAGYDATLAINIQNAISDNFYISPWIMFPVLVVIYGAVKRIPAIPSLLLASAVACVVAMLAQGASFPEVFGGLQYGFSADTGNEVADKLLNRGGVDSMMWTISLIMFALFFGGILEKCGFIEVLLGGIVKRVKTVGGLVTATIITGIICDVILTDQYLAIMVPSKMYAKSFDDRGLSRSFLSRTTEDGATLWSPMIPWNGCGAYQAATLGVSNWAFFPYAFMNLINPVLAIVMTYMGIGIKYKEEDGKTRAEIKEIKAKRKNG
ncbi:MAG: Na+/H+ antiporter NhaC [Clostridiales bacterium]|nr:Na+/H+ antiporter NhaC [Clostridiales bacterium]